MLVISSVFAILLLVVLVVQVKWANRFVDLYRPSTTPMPTYFPHVGVVMALRGADPFLKNNLQGIMSLDYPDHEIRIIVDSGEDPAFAVVEHMRREMGVDNVEVEILHLSQETSSLKNSALIQGIKGCSDKCEVFAWLDSDTVPHPGWLQDLIGPLQDEKVGASCGIRWYAPPTTTVANYVRHVWNCAAILQMVAYQIGWGGAFAMRKSVYKEIDLEGKWVRALVEDTLASNEILLGGRRVEFVAACTMTNPESATLGWCVKFVTRQLQGLRYYHDAWRTVLLFGLFSGFVLLANAVLVPWSLIASDAVSAMISGTTLATFGIVCAGLVYRSESRVNAYLGQRCVGTYSLPIMLAIAAPAAQVVHMIALVRAYVLSDVTWRGIRYRIRSGMDITRTNYAPYKAETDLLKHSL